MKKLLLMFLSVALVCSCAHKKPDSRVTSPDRNIAIDFYLTPDGQPAYKAFYKGESVVNESLLGFRLKDMPALEKGFRVLSSEVSRFDQTWEQPWGEERYIRNNYTELYVALQETAAPERKMNIIFRVFDDGFGFRYELPQQPGLASVEILEELTQFSMTGNHSAWWTPGQAGNQYEYLYENTPVNEMGLVHTPVTMSTDKGLYLSIHEAALHDYSTMNLQATGNGGIQAALVPWSPENPVAVKRNTPFATPWRTVQVAERPTDFITSYLILNLNEPNKLGDVSWVKPGKYVGIWWELHLEKGTWAQGPKHAANTANAKKYIDFAAKHGFDGVLIEGWNEGWDGEWWNHGGGDFNFTKPYPDYDVAEITRYAREHGVYIIGHHETGADTDNYERQLEDAYAFLEKYGMKAVKTGYVETGELLSNGNYHHGQSFVRHAQRVTEVAARHHVMVVAHETVKDTGERRTYPNLISREVARGQEYDAWGDDGGNPPNHTTIIPFTRMLSGPMDFTPGAFELTLPDRPNNQVNTTLAKQLALYVVIYSPVQMASDLPENYEAHPDAFQFIKDVPVDWETVHVLGGEIGEYISIARKERGGNDWFLGSITNEKARTVSLELDFLDKGKQYTATIYKDASNAHYHDNPAAYEIETRTVSASDTLSIPLAAGGGVAISFIQK